MHPLAALRAWARRAAAAFGTAPGPVPAPAEVGDGAGPPPVAISAEAQLVAATLDRGRIVLDCLTPPRDAPRAFTIIAAPPEHTRPGELRATVRTWLESDGWVGVVVLDEDDHRSVYVSDGTRGTVLTLARTEP
jgi:hypothetical protein